MREIEFLPPWYAQLQRRRRTLFIQVWLTLAIVAALALWLFMAERNRREKEVSLNIVSGQLRQTDGQLEQMERMEAARRKCRQKADVLAKLGTYVDSARILGKLSEVVPASVSLVDLSFQVEEAQAPLTGAARASLKDPKDAPMERKLRAKLQGVAPTDDEMGTLLTALNKVPFLENVTATFSRDKREAGHVFREFELVFTINLNTAAGS